MSGAQLIAGKLPTGRVAVGAIVPVYNTAATLGATLDSLMAQTLTAWHAVVVDDGSTDASLEIAKRYAQRDTRIALLAKQNGGVSSARNLGLDHVNARYTHHLDSDDWLTPTAYERMVAVAQASNLDACAASFDVTDDAGRTIYEHRQAMASIGLDELFDRVQVWTGAHIVRTEAAVRARFDESLVGYEDQDVWMRLARQGVRWAGAADVVACHRIRAGSLTRRRREMATCGQRVLERVWKQQAEAAGPERGLELTPGRLERAQGRLALGYATAEAMIVGVESGARLYREALGRKWVGSSEAAEAGRFAVIYGVGEKPRLGAEGSGEWLGPLLAWWGRLVEQGWAGEGLTRRAALRLAIQTLDADAVCDTILDRAPSGASIVVIGCGTNGRRLAARAAARGLAVRVRDDRFDADAHQAHGEAPLGATIEPMDAPIGHGDWAVITPLRDAGLVRRIGSERCALRWRDVVRRLALGAWAPEDSLRRSA